MIGNLEYQQIKYRNTCYIGSWKKGH